MAVSIKGMNAGQLLSLREEIDAALAKMVADLEKQIVQIKDLNFRATRGRKPGRSNSLKGRKAEPKYRNPVNPKETWAGRGMKPRWLTAALKSGKKIESFEIKK